MVDSAIDRGSIDNRSLVLRGGSSNFFHLDVIFYASSELTTSSSQAPKCIDVQASTHWNLQVTMLSKNPTYVLRNLMALTPPTSYLLALTSAPEIRSIL